MVLGSCIVLVSSSLDHRLWSCGASSSLLAMESLVASSFGRKGRAVKEIGRERCGRFPPEVRTAIPVEGRFEHIVLSCNATSDHGIIWIERESHKAVDLMKEMEVKPPAQQKMERLETLAKEHKDALGRAVSLNVPHAVAPTEESVDAAQATASEDQGGTTSTSHSEPTGRPNWDELVEKLFDRSNSGALVLKRDIKLAS